MFGLNKMSFAPANKTNNGVVTAILSDAEKVEPCGVVFPRKEATWPITDTHLKNGNWSDVVSQPANENCDDFSHGALEMVTTFNVGNVRLTCCALFLGHIHLTIVKVDYAEAHAHVQSSHLGEDQVRPLCLRFGSHTAPSLGPR
jgi:hypothetical protein